MAFCGNCGTKAVGEFCINCGKPTQLSAPVVQPVEPVAAPLPPVVETPVAPPAPVEVVEQVIEPEAIPEPPKPSRKKLEEPAPEVAEPVASIETEPAAFDEAVEDEEPAPRRKLSKRVALTLAASIVVLGAVLFPGSGELTVVYQDNTSEDNKAVDLTLQIAGEDIRIAKDADGELIYSGTWSSFQSGELRVIPDPKNDEVVTIAMPQLGSLGIWNLNRARVVTITANDRNLEVNLTGGDNFSEVGTVAAYRTFYARDLATCKEDFNEEYGYGINLRRNAYDNYLAFVEGAQLDGTRTLQYTTWASRADSLQAKMSNYLSLASANPLGTKNSGLNSAGDEVQDAIIKLQSAWKNLEAVSRAQSDSKWDGAWTKIYNAETALYDKVELFKPQAKGAGAKICDAQLNRE